MRRAFLILVATGAVCAGSLQAAPTTYTGTLTNGGGGDGSLFVTGAAWVAHPASLSWKVDNVTTPGRWHYEYTIVAPNVGGLLSDIQCVIIEASNGANGPAFTTDDLFAPTSSPDGWIQHIDVGVHSPADNPNLPRNLYGIKLCTFNIDPTTLTISFDTDRVPVWGDIYARSYVVDGQFGALYNVGLMGMPESDPSDPPGSGSILSHVLVPDSKSIPPVPVPGAAVLGTLGVPLASLLRRKRWM